MSGTVTATWITGDTLTVLRAMPDASVDLVMTSPPFLALRSYLPDDDPAKADEIGQESTPGEFLDVLLDITEELRRVLAPHGSICVELGDTYAGSTMAGGPPIGGSWIGTRTGAIDNRGRSGGQWPEDKSLTLIPELYRFALAYGFNPLTGRQTPRWRIRNVIRWVRPNPPVGALGDKFRPGTSEMVIATGTDEAGRTRYFDLDAVRTQAQVQPQRSTNGQKGGRVHAGDEGAVKQFEVRIDSNPAGAPPLDWWEIPTAPYKGSHYATYPPALCERPIKAMAPLKVCTTCGEPSRRITSEPTDLDERHDEFAKMLRKHRKAAGLTLRDVDALFGFNGMASHWESSKTQRAYPTAEQWPKLRSALSITTDEFDDVIEGSRRWAEDQATYVDGDGSDVAPHVWSSGIAEGKGAHSNKATSATRQTTTLGWTDCGHGTWRPGLVLDPFGGSGTTLAVATGHGRDAIGIDLDARNLDLARQRIGPMWFHDATEEWRARAMFAWLASWVTSGVAPAEREAA